MKKRRTLRTTHQTTRTAAMPNRAAARDGGDVAVWSAVFQLGLGRQFAPRLSRGVWGTSVKYYSVDIQVDFASPREIPPQARSGKPWAAVGYFQYFFCSERSKERAQALALDFVRNNDERAGECRVRCIRVAWMRTLREREEIAFGEAAGLTEAMFAKKDEIGIWFHSEKGYYVSELDAALDSEAHAEGERRP